MRGMQSRGIMSACGKRDGQYFARMEVIGVVVILCVDQLICAVLSI